MKKKRIVKLFAAMMVILMLGGDGDVYGDASIGPVEVVIIPAEDSNEPDGMEWVYIEDPGVDGHEGFSGYMNRYETTNAQYCYYLNAALASGDITVDGSTVYGASGSNGGADFVGEIYYDLAGPGYNNNGATNGGAARINYNGGSFTVDSGFENHPVTYVSWYGSTAFCNYYGYRLATEWEWQAVADYDGSYMYGCGATIDNNIANYEGSTHPDGTTVAGAFGTYGYGMADMAGNVYEWVSNCYDGDCSLRILRGGGWGDNPSGCAVSNDDHYTPEGTNGYVGFRVVLKPGSSLPGYHVDLAGGSDDNDGLSRERAFASVQRGIEAALDGDTVFVWPGVYSEAINFRGKAITVASADYPAVLEAPLWFDAVTFHTGEGAGSVLRNFVIRNSDLAVSLNYGSNPTLSNLTIVDDLFGIACYDDSAPVISNCIFYNNSQGDLFGCGARYSWVDGQGGPSEGLVGYWNFDEGEGTTANDSGGTNHGTINGATWTTGQVGGALEFDGVDDYVNIPDSGDFDFGAGDFSMSLWMQTDGPSNIHGEQYILDFRQNDNDPHIELYTTTAQGRWGYLGTHSEPIEQQHVRVDYWDSNINDGRWHHISITLVNGTAGGYKLYLDGVEVGQATFSGTLSDWDTIKIGGDDVHQPDFFHGLIDEVRVYSRALSAEQIWELYQAGLSGHGLPTGPLFVDAENGDYHLRSERGRYWPEHDVWVLDKVTSAGVDGGDPGMDPGNEPGPNGGRINMGAYGGTAYASMSEWPLRFDSNRDGVVNMFDFAEMAQEWLDTVDSGR